MIKTKNLELIPVEPMHVSAFSHDRSDLAAILQVTIPDRWPHFPEAFSLPDIQSRPTNSHQIHWHGYFFIHPKNRVLVGNGGFKGAPNEFGIVELGYEIAGEYWNCGFATEAVRGMLEFAFACEDVQAVIAHTLGHTNASNKVLQKVGMKFIAEMDDSEVGKIWLWQINRDEYSSL
jgi:[ribosomal protein S5]-alanine N-acetyltransferase